MQTFYHNLDTATTSLLSFDPGVAEYSAPKGQKMIQFIFQRGNSTSGVNVKLLNTVVKLVMRNPQKRCQIPFNMAR